ncbi:uncharacterized protein F5147DRAFT_791703 [Suillus discolor]|uniref:Uncharacterized protein n=1 Tax=Suillus discolor TaxID=1912936 RepID=A0A9P7JLA5_9AGAM|nr:uncharacterized protein F5147DRAFT_791703 [Suillus discolor]KAG2086657.1 hypothetical protein F5147DRAFT_791703 [Suillus discolor]
MFQHGYHLHIPSGSNQRPRSPSRAEQLLKPQSNPGTLGARSIGRSTTPDPGSGSSSNYLSAGGHDTSCSPNHQSTTPSGDGPVVPGLEVQPPCSPTSSLDEPISTAVRRRRNSGTFNHGDPMKLTPQRTKHLKTYAKKICEDNDVPTRDVMCFIDSGNIFFMIIDLKITLIKLCKVNRAKRMQELKDALESKDFEVTMDFITTHSDVFKIPPGMLEDVKLRAQLGKSVTKLLTGIQSVIKNALTASVVKRTSIADVTRALACSGSGMEVDSTHWNRIALLWHLLQIFLIGVSDYKNASINDLFSPYLIPSLKQDIWRKVERELGVNIAQLEDDLFGTNDALESNDQASPDTPTGNGHAPNARRIEDGANMDNEELEDQSGVQIGGGDANGEEEELNGLGNSVKTAAVLLDDPMDSGFGLVEGTPAQYTNTIRFWNFVDHLLLVMRQISKEASLIPTEQEKELQKLFIEIFQADLAEFPGGKKVSKLISRTNPRWQTTIQTKLIWTT